MVCVFFMGEYKNPAGARYEIGAAGGEYPVKLY